MAREITSKHLIGSTELTVIMPIRQGFVDARDTITYATRLRMMLRILNGIRKASRESVIAREYVGPIERLQTINDARFGLLENDTRLLLAVSFDEPWEPYIRSIRDNAGPLLDAICSHCDGYTDEYDSEQGYEKFAEWVRSNQVDTEFFYTAQPSLTTDDYRYLKKLETLQRNTRNTDHFDQYVPQMVLKSPTEEAADAAKDSLTAPSSQTGLHDDNRTDRLIKQGLRAVQAMYALNAFYPDKPKKDSPEEREKNFWLKAAQSVLMQFDSEKLVPRGTPRYRQYQDELEWFQTKVEPKPPAPISAVPGIWKNIQGNIVRPFRNMTVSCLLLMQFTTESDGRIFLREMCKRVAKESGPNGQRPDVNPAITISLTRHGLKSLGVSDKVYSHFPKEFREGMEARAGMLGDIRENHPLHWKLPEWNWPLSRKNKFRGKNSVRQVRLSTVDVVVQLHTRLDHENPQSPNYQFDKNRRLYEIDRIHPLYKEIRKIEKIGGARVLSVEPMRRKFKKKMTNVFPDGKRRHLKRYPEDHFGYADGISQPKPKEVPKDRDDVSYGELIIGYGTDKGRNDDKGAEADLDAEKYAQSILHNSTFLVVRKLRQYVGRFRKFIRKESMRNDIGKKELKGKLMGRLPSGKPMAKVGHIQDFDYQNDPAGQGCPFQAHVRRTNPRPKPIPGYKPDPRAKGRKDVPRIMRRGMSYGPRYDDDQSDKVDRGLIFMSYSASIAEQFEKIQRWITGGNSSGVFSGQDDPLLGVPPPKTEKRTFRFFHDTETARCNLKNKHFVELQWGMYLFMPSIPTMERLAKGFKEKQKGEEGAEIISKLQELEKARGKKKAFEAWKSVLEDRSARLGGATAAVWETIRVQCDGQLKTPYGLLIGNYKKVDYALNSPQLYSAREYWFRMTKSIGEGFLGMDPDRIESEFPPNSAAKIRDEIYTDAVLRKTYGQQSKPINKCLFAVSAADAYPVARRYMREAIHKKANHKVLDLRQISGKVMMALGRHYLGIPVRPDADTIRGFLFAAKYIFSSPNPTDYLRRQSRAQGQAELQKVRDFVERQRDKHSSEDPGLITKQLLAMKMFPNNKAGNEFLAKTISALFNGMVAPTMGSYLSMAFQLIESERLWRIQQELLITVPKKKDRGDYTNVHKIIEPVITEAMLANPVPDMVHRRNTKKIPYKDWRFENGKLESKSPTPGDLPVGSTIILNIESVTHEEPRNDKAWDVTFGGKYDANSKSGTHACPGAEMGIGIMAGMLTALLESGNLRPDNSPLTLTRNLDPDEAV